MGLSLQKGQSLSLTKQNGDSLTNVRLGLGWDSAVPAKKGFFGGSKTVEIDLDASALLFDADRQAPRHRLLQPAHQQGRVHPPHRRQPDRRRRRRRRDPDGGPAEGLGRQSGTSFS